MTLHLTQNDNPLPFSDIFISNINVISSSRSHKPGMAGGSFIKAFGCDCSAHKIPTPLVSHRFIKSVVYDINCNSLVHSHNLHRCRKSIYSIKTVSHPALPELLSDCSRAPVPTPAHCAEYTGPKLVLILSFLQPQHDPHLMFPNPMSTRAFKQTNNPLLPSVYRCL